MEITRDQAANFWNYAPTFPMEFKFYMMMPSFFEIDKDDAYYKRMFRDDVQIKRNAEQLADIINELNLPADGDNNKVVGVMNLARAYVNFLNDSFNNNTYMNAGSFWLICCRIALHVN